MNNKNEEEIKKIKTNLLNFPIRQAVILLKNNWNNYTFNEGKKLNQFGIV
jgi:hypothetical protein